MATADLNSPPSGSIEFFFPSSITCKGNSIRSWDPRGTTAFISATTVFESVELLSLDVTVAPAPADSGYVTIGMYDRLITVTETSRYDSVCFSQTYVSESAGPPIHLSLPATHPFGVELKATTLGNNSPKVTLTTSAFPDSRKETACAVAHVVLRCRGRGLAANRQ